MCIICGVPLQREHPLFVSWFIYLCHFLCSVSGHSAEVCGWFIHRHPQHQPSCTSSCQILFRPVGWAGSAAQHHGPGDHPHLENQQVTGWKTLILGLDVELEARNGSWAVRHMKHSIDMLRGEFHPSRDWRSTPHRTYGQQLVLWCYCTRTLLADLVETAEICQGLPGLMNLARDLLNCLLLWSIWLIHEEHMTS